MSEALLYSIEEDEHVLTRAMEDMDDWQPLGQATLEAWGLDEVSQATRDATFGSLSQLRTEIDEPPALHVMEEGSGIPYAGGLVPRFDTEGRKLAPLYVIKLTESNQGGLHAT